jgi:hypothetical protein
MVEEFLANDHVVPILLSSLGYKELGRSARVCRVLCEVARDLPRYGERGRVLRLIDKGIQQHKMVFGKYTIGLRSKNITDLTAFRDCADKLRDLQTLHLYDNQISDVSPLATLVNLQELYLENNQISDVGPLGTLVNLQRLDLSFNQISDEATVRRMFPNAHVSI